MIVLGNHEFALGFKLSGVKDSYVITERQQVIELLSILKNKNLVLANTSVVKMFPELQELKNVIIVPDEPENFSDISDLKDIIRKVIGKELEVV